MKKRTLTFILAFSMIYSISNAQGDDKKEIGGIRGGFHYALMQEEGSKPDTADSLRTF